jgi:hypothetical protein
MNPEEHGATTLTNEDGTWVLTLEGEHDLTTVPRLEHQMKQVCSSGTSFRTQPPPPPTTLSPGAGVAPKNLRTTCNPRQG